MPIKIKSTGGGSVSIDVPNTGSDFTLTAPAISGNIITSGDTATITQAMLGANSVIQSKLANGISTSGPTFSVYRSAAQTITNNNFTRINFEIEEFDTANCYDNSTNYRFIPNVAGYYFITCQVHAVFTSAIGSTLIAGIYKNGSIVGQNYVTCAAVLNTYGSSVTKLIYMNGSTDYIEGYVYQNNGGDRALGVGLAGTWMSGFLARAA